MSSGNKLWIGNLDKRLSEYNLLKILQRYGEVENFQYLFHTVGPKKGEPRTYCFVEYKNRKDAEHALEILNGKIILSHTLKVHWANEDVKTKDSDSEKSESKMLQKTPINPVLSHEEKIKAIEDKLRGMEEPEGVGPRPPLFRGKHRLLVESDNQRKEVTRKSKQKSRRPYSVPRK